MKILISAYACEPNRGSEPGVGWNWAKELGLKGHDVTVITRLNNKESIEQASKLTNVKFIYYDLPELLKKWKKGNRGVHLYYFLWQLCIYKIAKKLVVEEQYDVIHHVTFVSIRQPSFLGALNVPFVFGPVAGGESIPKLQRAGMSIRATGREKIRDCINGLVKYDPFMRLTFKSANKIFVTSEETKQLLPRRYQKEAEVKLAIGVDTSDSFPVERAAEKKLRILYVGNFIYLKGIHLALRAFAEFLKVKPNAKFTLVGKGEEKEKLQILASELNITSKLEWVNWVAQDELPLLYQKNDVLLFPSLRDSGGMVVLEALSFGTPVICFNIGGPGTIVNESCGLKVNIDNICDLQAIKRLKEQLCKLDESTLKKLSKGAFMEAKRHSWDKLSEGVYENINCS
ncbi:glycosyltransferase family 4 protein [Thalassotalea litorea]|uniref:Glycosyltransferase family 4 protein n=1 Tax=Thalassotalea litorea TaxID=2020715 RepID=A0A5R9IT18_9GAMM|nr:glycosyltransferase family 4 protein [Thalassotalea litorea]TLU65068.1 glycosyltransferase family 4 protein [Thalassotalea litorea]